MLTTIHSRWLPRRGIHRAASRRVGAVHATEVGAWASPPAPPPPEAEVAPADAGAPPVVGAGPAAPAADDPAPPEKLAIDWPRLLAAGHPRDPDARQLEALRRLAAPLLDQAFAADAGKRDRMILFTSAGLEAGPEEGGSCAAADLALCLARDHPVLLVDADPERARVGHRFGIAGHRGLSDALADPDLALERLIVATDLDHLALLAPGAARPDLLDLLASRGAAALTRALLAGDPRRLILIDGPPLARLEGRALALFAGQVVLVVEAGATPRRSIEAAIERLGKRPNRYLLLADATTTEALSGPRGLDPAGERISRRKASSGRWV